MPRKGNVLAAIYNPANALDCAPVSACLALRRKNPSGLMSLLDIVQYFMVWQLAKALEWLKEIEQQCEHACRLDSADREMPQGTIRNNVRPMLDYSRQQFVNAELYAAVHRIDQPFRLALVNDSITYRELRSQAKALLEAVDGELAFRRFAYVPTEKAQMLDGIARDWEVIWNKFRESEVDSRAAVECYALDQNTACVFHLIRVSEYGLRALARQVKAKLTHKGKTHPIEYADWDKVITEVQNKISKARSLPHGAKRASQLKLYSDAADHCLYMKELRNEISHTRKDFNSGEAFGVLQRVFSFMTFLAQGS